MHLFFFLLLFSQRFVQPQLFTSLQVFLSVAQCNSSGSKSQSQCHGSSTVTVSFSTTLFVFFTSSVVVCVQIFIFDFFKVISTFLRRFLPPTSHFSIYFSHVGTCEQRNGAWISRVGSLARLSSALPEAEVVIFFGREGFKLFICFCMPMLHRLLSPFIWETFCIQICLSLLQFRIWTL